MAATRDRLADLDRSQLPSVEQAQAMQAERHHVPEAAQEARQQPEPQPGAETRAGQERAAPAPEKPPLGKTAAQIHAAWNDTRNASDPAAAFVQAIEDRGPSLVYVSADEAKASERARSFAKAIDRQNRALREGFAVVDERGTVTRIDQRVTGDLWHEIEQRLAGIDRTNLLTVAEARDVMKEANREAWQQQKDAERAEARRDAPVSGTAAEIRVAWALSRTPSEIEDALAARGIGLALVSPEEAYASERRAALAKEAGKFAPVLREGEIVAVNGRGSVYRLDERTTGDMRPEIEGRLSRHRPRRPDECGRHQGSDARGGMGGGAERAPGRAGTGPPGKRHRDEEFSPRMRRRGSDRQKFDAALEKEGLGLARVTASRCMTALDALQEGRGFDRRPRSRPSGKIFPLCWKSTSSPPIDRFGGVHPAFNPHHVRDIERQLAEPKPNSIAPVDAPAWQPLPSVVELRAGFEGDRDLRRRAFTTPSSRDDTSRTSATSWRSTSTVWSRPKGGRSYGRPRAPPRRSRMCGIRDAGCRRRLQVLDVASGFLGSAVKIVTAIRGFLAGCSAARKLTPAAGARPRPRRAATRKPCTRATTPRRFRPRKPSLTTGCTRRKPASRNRI